MQDLKVFQVSYALFDGFLSDMRIQTSNAQQVPVAQTLDVNMEDLFGCRTSPESLLLASSKIPISGTTGSSMRQDCILALQNYIPYVRDRFDCKWKT